MKTKKASRNQLQHTTVCKRGFIKPTSQMRPYREALKLKSISLQLSQVRSLSTAPCSLSQSEVGSHAHWFLKDGTLLRGPEEQKKASG